jgi:hypothetical protein
MDDREVNASQWTVLVIIGEVSVLRPGQHTGTNTSIKLLGITQLF